MSTWYETKIEDVSVDGDELNIYVTSDDSGNVYTTIKIEQLIQFLRDNGLL